MSEIEAHLMAVAIRYLTVRSRFTKEVEDRLNQEIYKKKLTADSKDIDSIIRKLKDKHFLDDEKFATEYASYQLCTKNRGPLFIKAKLAFFGVDRVLIAQIANDILTPAAQLPIVSRLISKKIKHPDWSDLRQKSKVYRYLSSRGFESDIIRSVIDV